MAQLVGPVMPVDCGEKGLWTQRYLTQLIIRTEFLLKSKKILEVTCQIRLGGYYSRPIGLTPILGHGSLAQLVEQLAFNQLVAGSNPARPTISKSQHILCLSKNSMSVQKALHFDNLKGGSRGPVLTRRRVFI